MPNLLIVSATTFEIEPALKYLRSLDVIDDHCFKKGSVQIEVCITGVGMVNTAFELGKKSANRYDLVINAGVAGCFTDRSIGEVVSVTNDCFSELGAENDEIFLTIDELGFGSQKQKLLKVARSLTVSQLAEVTGITVNTVHGNSGSIDNIKNKYQAEVESMEGAAFVYAANQSKWTAVQLRAISNKVEVRNKDNWNLPLAVTRLNEILIKIFEEYI